MHCPFLVGERVYLRAVERSDAAVIAPWLNSQQVAQYLRFHRLISIGVEEEFIDALYRPGAAVTALGIVLKEEDRLIGVTGFQDVDENCRNASVGITIGEVEEWSKGYGTESLGLLIGHLFDTLNLHRVWLHVREDNIRGLRSYEKLGFQIEGRLRQHTYREGRYWDVLTMGLLRDEWRRQRD